MKSDPAAQRLPYASPRPSALPLACVCLILLNGLCLLLCSTALLLDVKPEVASFIPATFQGWPLILVLVLAVPVELAFGMGGTALYLWRRRTLGPNLRKWLVLITAFSSLAAIAELVVIVYVISRPDFLKGMIS